MSSIKFMALFILATMSAFKPKEPPTNPVRWVLTKECSLKVNGSTNINKFSCVIPSYINPDTLFLYKGNTNEAVKISGDMRLNIKYFDCHNPMMTKDLRKTLKADEFPNLVIKFMNLSRYPNFDTKETAVKGMVTITLAGVTKQFNVDYKCTNTGSKTITMVGTKQVNFSDFNIVPPRKLGGMIKTNNLLDVEFILKASILN